MRVAADVLAKLLKHDKPIQDEDWVLDPETGQVYKVDPPQPKTQHRASQVKLTTTQTPAPTARYQAPSFIHE
jgi:hypothetical protein